MRIIISPAKTMNVDNDCFLPTQTPLFLDETKKILAYLQGLNYDNLKSLWKCSDKIAQLNFDRLQDMDLAANLTPAIFSYEGLQYQHIAPNILEQNELDYLDEHLRIISGFYGVIRPMEGIVPYRIEMQAKATIGGLNSLYDFWDSKIFDQLSKESQIIVNLASKEYSKCISKYLKANDNITFITCVFGEISNGKVVEKGTMAKIARGEMVRYMAKRQVSKIEEIKLFDHPDFGFSEEFSNKQTFVFLKK